MVEITKEELNSGHFVDKHMIKERKNAFTNKISTDGKILLYLFGALAIFCIANGFLIYNFCKILVKI